MMARTSPASSAFLLTPRDNAILDMVHDLRGCTSSQIHSRFWGANRPRAACYRRIAGLIREGYLCARRLPSLSGVGSGKRFLTLGEAGRDLIAQRLRVSVDVIGISDPKTPLFVHHHEAVSDFRIAVEIGARSLEHVEIRSWFDEPSLRSRPIRLTDTFDVRGEKRKRNLTMVPDAEFTLAVGDSVQSFLLEMDMATITMSRLALRLRGYLRFRLTRGIPILFVVPDSDRTAQIQQTIVSEARDLRLSPVGFLVATRASITATSVLTAPIWEGANGEKLALLPPSMVTRLAATQEVPWAS
jgi:Replication-relaxation